MKNIDLDAITASAIAISFLATLAKSAVNPIAFIAVCGIIVLLLAKILGLRYVGNLSEVSNVSPALLNIHFCASLLVSTFLLAVTAGG